MKNYNVLFSPEAENETKEAYLWYQEKRPGLGNAFRESLRIKIESLKQNPKSASFVYKNVRSFRIKQFPFNIIYRISDSQIQIIAVFHHSRNPREWEKRI